LLDDGRICVQRTGQGRPVVCSHGLGDSTATWSELLGTLAAGFETLAWDLRGHGESARPEAREEYSRELALADLDQIRLPVLQIVGAKDSAYHGAFEYLKRRIDGVESLMIPSAGHHVHRTHAVEVGKAISAFLEPLP
jgi:pimeloyl-ACP methyl ester carboxylesterase